MEVEKNADIWKISGWQIQGKVSSFPFEMRLLLLFSRFLIRSRKYTKEKTNVYTLITRRVSEDVSHEVS